MMIAKPRVTAKRGMYGTRTVSLCCRWTLDPDISSSGTRDSVSHVAVVSSMPCWSMRSHTWLMAVLRTGTPASVAR
eukprot:4507464-Pleurochrysis_carterae.AAC.1